MPIGLLLTSLSTPLAGLATAFERWNAVLRLEAVVMDRARSAFLMEWFGVRVPRLDGRLRVVIANIAAVGERYREARAQSKGGQTGPNLLEPVAGLAGMAAGMFISPSGSIMYLYACLRESLGAILSSVLTVLFSPIFLAEITGLGTAVAVIAFPIVLIGGFVAAIIAAAGGPNSSMVLVFELVGDVARVIQGLTRFIGLLTGPREAIRNPLLRGILRLLDSVAALLAQLIGAAAWVLTRIGPLILRNAIEFRAMQRLGEFAFELIGRIARGAFDALAQLWRSDEGQRASPWAIVLSMLDHVMAVAGAMVAGAHAVLSEVGRQLSEGLTRISNNATGHVRHVASAASALIGNIPLMRTFLGGAAMVTAVRSIFSGGASAVAPPAPPPSSSGGAIASALAPAGLAVSLLNEPPPPSLAAAEAMVAAARAGGAPITSPWGPDYTTAMAAPFELDPATADLARQLIEPPASVFAGERRAISEELGGGTVEAGLDALRTHELRYRDLLYAIVGRVLPAQARVRIPELLDAFNAIDRYVYDHRDTPEGPSEFPVRDLPDNGRLRPVVRRLVVRSAGGGDEVSLRNIATDLSRLLREQTYLAPAG